LTNRHYPIKALFEKNVKESYNHIWKLEEIMEAIGKVNDIHLLMNEPMQGKGQQIPM
jgi:ferritin-like metal-binding protein YciE